MLSDSMPAAVGQGDRRVQDPLPVERVLGSRALDRLGSCVMRSSVGLGWA